MGRNLPSERCTTTVYDESGTDRYIIEKRESARLFRGLRVYNRGNLGRPTRERGDMHMQRPGGLDGGVAFRRPYSMPLFFVMPAYGEGGRGGCVVEGVLNHCGGVVMKENQPRVVQTQIKR